jgi:predicted DCC family thiol-disulfide oxidoreductase YuxK
MTVFPSNVIILYDGVCGLCNRWVQLVLKHDSRDRFRFASLQSDFSARLLARHGVTPQLLDTMYAVLNHSLAEERLVSRSAAVVAILRELAGVWGALGALLAFLPETLRDAAYNLLARHRYRIFGKYDACPLPDEQYRNRFID